MPKAFSFVQNAAEGANQLREVAEKAEIPVPDDVNRYVIDENVMRGHLFLILRRSRRTLLSFGVGLIFSLGFNPAEASSEKVYWGGGVCLI